MKHSTFTLTLLTWLFCHSLNAAEFKSEPVTHNGMLIGHISVPSHLQCHQETSDLPTTLCSGSNELIYHTYSRFVTTTEDPEAFYKSFIHAIQLDSPNTKIVKQSIDPATTKTIQREYSQLHPIDAKDIISYRLEIDEQEQNEIGVLTVTLMKLHNGQNPLMFIQMHGINKNKSNTDKSVTLNDELNRFVGSLQISSSWLKIVTRLMIEPDQINPPEKYIGNPDTKTPANLNECRKQGVSHSDFINGAGRARQEFRDLCRFLEFGESVLY
jgi:hypothetical protein